MRAAAAAQCPLAVVAKRLAAMTETSFAEQPVPCTLAVALPEALAAPPEALASAASPPEAHENVQ